MTRWSHGRARRLAQLRATQHALLVLAFGAPLVAAVASTVPPAGASTQVGTVEVFMHPRHSGAWTAHRLAGVVAGVGAPSVAATTGGDLVLAQRVISGDVTVAVGAPTGQFTTTDLATAAGAPAAVGRIVVDTAAGISVWYRTGVGDLEVVHRPAGAGGWLATDVSASAGAGPIAGDPAVVPTRAGSPVAYAATAAGGIAAFSAPTTPSGAWVESDPTGGLVTPPLAGPIGVPGAFGATWATVLLATTTSGHVVEISNQLPGPFAAIGPWHQSDLTALGAPRASGELRTAAKGSGLATYLSPDGDLVELALATGLPDGFTTTDLTRTADAAPAPGAVPVLMEGPAGEAVAVRTTLGDVTLVPIAPHGLVVDATFQAGTAEYVASDLAGTTVAGSDVVVAADGGPIAPTPLLRRILILASSFDQQHRELQTTPSGTDCNPFTAAFGRGSSWGCRSGTSAEPWCSDFAQWVWQTAGVPTRGITGWSATFVQWGAAHHRVQFGTHFHAQVGDAIVWGTRAPLYGTHVAIIVAVHGTSIDVENGNDGGDLPGYGEGVWRSGPFIGSSSTVSGYPVLGVVTP